MRTNMIIGNAKTGRDGFFLIVLVILMLFMSLVVTSVTHVIRSGLNSIVSKSCKLQALHNAQSGIRRVIYEYMKDPQYPIVDIGAINGDSATRDLYQISTDQSFMRGPRPV